MDTKPKAIVWPMNITSVERAEIEDLVQKHDGRISRSALMRGLLRYALAAAKADPNVAVEYLSPTHYA